MGSTSQMQSPSEMLERWMGIECKCDPDVGHLCELCHDMQVVRDLINRLALAEAALKRFTDYYQHGINPDLDEAYRDSRELLKGIEKGKGEHQ